MFSAPDWRVYGLAAISLISAGLAHGVEQITPPASAPTAPPAPATSVALTLTPAQTLSAPNIVKLRVLKTATGAPEIPTPNPWFTTQPYQGTITRAEFGKKLHELYDPFNAFAPFLDVNDQRAVIYSSPKDHRLPQFTLNFAPPNTTAPAPPRWFRTPAEYRAEAHPLNRPLEGLRVAIDPGHIGGEWAEMEERSTRYHGSAPVREGDLNLITGRILRQQLIDLGASVFVVRDSTDPVTPYRPRDFMPEARELLVDRSSIASRIRAFPPDKLNLMFGNRLNELADFLFFRCSEIIERGNRIRDNFVPDITVTLYIDATPGSGRGRLTDANENIFFVHGAYTRAEMADAEMQRRCVYKMLEGSSDIEAEVAADIASTFSEKTHLGPVKYGDSLTTREVLPGNLYVVARNLAANREYDGPVVCTEPYFMNNRLTYQRLLAGDYDGQRTFNGLPFVSIFREYAGCVASGLIKAYAKPMIIAGSGSSIPPK